MIDNSNYRLAPVGTGMILFFGFIVLFLGCSDTREVPTLPGAHPASWMDENSSDFHGEISLINGTTSCKNCHGTGGDDSGIATFCNDCHSRQTDICVSCHGGLDNNSGAPPLGLRGQSEDTALAVGAHTVHLEGSVMATGFECNVCHIVPVSILDAAHLGDILNGLQQPPDFIAEIVWHGIADGGDADWDRTARTCANIYCHGNFGGGKRQNEPVWTGANQADCGSCHDDGENPELLGWKHQFHVSLAGLACGECHASVVDNSSNFIDPALHVNGIVDTLIRDTVVCNACHGSGSEACAFCHGGIDNLTGAPPKGLRGETSTATIAVGAHTTHVDGGNNSRAVDCSECHIVPTSTFSSGHLGQDSLAEIAWGPLAGIESSWDHSTSICNSTYCHGNFPGGKMINAPVWTENNQAECGTCHDIGENPVELLWKHEYHINAANLQCADCHSAVVDQSLNIVDRNLHIDGVVDTLIRDQEICDACHGASPEACTTCHGGVDNMSGAPPKGLRGETSTSSIAVGAHTNHLEEGIMADAFDCSECHIVPTSLFTQNHLGSDSLAEITWGTLAGQQSVWNHATTRCSNVYCHGNFSGGLTANSPLWTGADQAICGSCHDVGSNPGLLSGRHRKHIVDEDLLCYQCHSTTVNDQLQIVGKSVHVDGIKTVDLAGPGFYSNGTCSGLGFGCHGAKSWFED